MYKKKFIYQLLEKKFIFFFIITSITIYFLTLNILNLGNNKHTIRIYPNKDIIYLSKFFFLKSAKHANQGEFLDEKNLVDDFVHQFFQENEKINLRFKVKKINTSTIYFLIFDIKTKFEYKIILDSLNSTQNNFVEDNKKKIILNYMSYNEEEILEQIKRITSTNDDSINLDKKLNEFKLSLGERNKAFNNFILRLEKEKFFVFKKVTDYETIISSEYHKLIAIIISILSGLFVNIAILIFTRYRKYL